MKFKPLTGALLLHACVPALAQQAPFSSQDESYAFNWPIKKVAIIGAGPGGLIAYRQLTDPQNNFNYTVHLIERDTHPGGNWHYTDEVPFVTPIPSAPIEVGDYVPSLPPRGVELPYQRVYSGDAAERVRREQRAPKPLWKGLKSNAPAPIQQIREWPWPKGTPWELPHLSLQRYIRSYASYVGINTNDDNPDVFYNTRVERADESYDNFGERNGWSLTLRSVTVKDDRALVKWYKEHYDAIIVATGRYNAPNVPPIPGLAAWAQRFPRKIIHSREYRVPEAFTGKRVLIVGAATSGGEISREINPLAKEVIQSIRPDNATVPHFDLATFLRRLPRNTTIVPEIKRFLPPPSGKGIEDSGVELGNGTILTGIDTIIFGTGYRYTYPFLPQFINSSLGTNGSIPRNPKTKQPIITDGTHVRSLYLDTFYIDDPSLAFINVNSGMQSFTYAEFLSLAIGKVWSHSAYLPSTPNLWAFYDETVREREGYGRHFQFLGPDRTKKLLRFFVGWLNDAAVRFGGRQIDALPSELEEIQKVWWPARFGRPDFAVVNAVNAFADEQRSEEGLYENAYDDWW